MTRSPLIVLACLLALGAHAQPYGNEWIHHDRPYWSFPVWQDGIRRIDSTTLAAAGFPLSTVDPRTIQLFARGRQVPIHVEGEEDGVFNGSDFIEFHGLKNDAWLDSALWDDPAHINNPYYSLFNDTIRYFLSWGPQAEALRAMRANSSNWAAYTPLAWCWGTTRLEYAQTYQDGKRTPQGGALAQYGEAEGYFQGQPIIAAGADASRNYTLSLAHRYTGPDPPDATYNLVIASLTNPGGGDCNDHHLRVEHAGVVHADTVFNGYRLLKYQFQFPDASLAGTNTVITATAVHDQTCTGLAPDYVDAVAPAWQSIRYPRTFNFGAGATVEVPGQTGPDSTLLAFIATGGSPVVYAYAANGLHRLQAVHASGNQHRAVLPPQAQDMRIAVAGQASIAPVAALAPVNGTGYFTDLGAGLPDSALVIVTHPTLMAAAMQYANYRETNFHNRYSTVVADVEQLYHQFGGGVRLHPMAIRNFLRYVHDHAPTRPQGLFLVGKGVKAPATGSMDFNRGYRKDTLAAAACLVPPIGWPSSDMLYGMDLQGNQPAFLSVPVGRLAASTPAQVLDYLAKVQSVEAQEPAAWMKNILHFRGGNTAWERMQFDAALNSFRVLAEDSLFFGNVTKFVKDGSGVIEQAAADSVSDLIEQGVTLMTFFAHAYAGGFDITIDVPSNYDWHGKYPTILGNSCYTGDIHLYDAASVSERFVLHQDAGAVAFLSSMHIGLSHLLRAYSERFYRSFSQVNYGRSIGSHMRYAALDQMASPEINPRNNAQTMTLHGDPTLVMNSPRLPDLEITLPDVRTIPQQVTADLDSFQVQVVFRNIGRGTHQPFQVALERTLVSEGVTLLPLYQQVSMNAWQDTLLFTLPTSVAAGGLGLNDLHIRLDMDPDQIAELDDTGNNQVTFRMSISAGDLLPVEPYNFAITSDPAPTLKASTGDPFAEPRNYIFQIDTTDLFNSPVMEQHSFTAPGGVVQWQPSSIYALNAGQDSVVYFWRCTLDSAGQGGYNWHEFSFQHLNGRQGWGQSHIFQFKDDEFNLMEHVRPSRSMEFDGGSHEIFCEVRGNHHHQTYWRLDLEIMDGEGCQNYSAMHVAVVDPFDLSPWLSRYNGVGRYYGNVNDNGHCRQRQEKYFIFRNNSPDQLNSMATMLSDTIPDGHFVLVYTYLRLDRTALENTSGMAAMQGLGALDLASGSVPDSVPYIFFCRKGDPASVQEVWGDSATAVIYMSGAFNLSARSGSVRAPRSHTALSWESLSWKIDPVQAMDSVRVQLAGIGQQGVEQSLLDLPGFSGELDLQPLFTAQQFPQLRLKGRFWNDSLVAPRPAQLRRWQLLGTPAPECAIDPPMGFFAQLDSMFQGQQNEVMVAVRNIGQVPMDSLLMTAWVTDQNNQAHRVHYKRNAPLPVDGVLQDTIRFSSLAFPGANTLTIEANPIDTLTQQYDQPEQHHFNNIAVLRFLTLQDLENPVLDVTFDGMHILDGDIVSAQPEILVTLLDENQTLLLNEPTDTALFRVFLTDSSGTMKRIYFREGSEEVLQFVPATGPTNLSKVFYRPNFTQDGMYRLTVRATDKSRNSSGERDNSVNFEVINRSTITEVLNYPNPFTTSTRFVFTLTGREVPSAMRIQIMTISGRVVREIGMSELGSLRVGRNITEFAWDGTDQFGDRLARGVYLYRVMAQINGQDIEYRDGGAGSYFKKGFGKMYLLR